MTFLGCNMLHQPDNKKIAQIHKGSKITQFLVNS